MRSRGGSGPHGERVCQVLGLAGEVIDRAAFGAVGVDHVVLTATVRIPGASPGRLDRGRTGWHGNDMVKGLEAIERRSARWARTCSVAMAIVVGLWACGDDGSSTAQAGAPATPPTITPPNLTPPNLTPPNLTPPGDPPAPPLTPPPVVPPGDAPPTPPTPPVPPAGDDLDAFTLPATLSQTGLYADVASGTLAEGVVPYAPRFELWSDGASKRRWLKLPPGTQIDTQDMDAWTYPVGTKAFKEFSRDGVRVETRLLQKQNFGWLAVAYLWRDDMSDADAVPRGQADARGTPHDVPNEDSCYECHEGRPDMLLGVGAMQLAWDAPAEPGSATLASLASMGRLTTTPPATLPVPGDGTAQAALGGLHANCGSCHNPLNAETFSKAPGLDLWLPTDPITDVAQTPAYLSTVDQELGDADDMFTLRIVAGDPAQSGMLDRIMLPPGSSKAMPPIAIELVDDGFVATLRAWITDLQ